MGSGEQFSNQSQFLENNVADDFILVFPDDALNLINIRTWNAGGCCGYAMNNDIADVGFFDVMLDHIITDNTGAMNRIYFTGMSNGGFMS